jgi:hypothetical protein
VIEIASPRVNPGIRPVSGSRGEEVEEEDLSTNILVGGDCWNPLPTCITP